MQIIANAAPIGFEAEFTNQRGNEILYRGIMMPFSSNDEDIDFVYGVINWKEVANEWRDVGIEIETDEDAKAGPADINAIWDTALEVEEDTDEDEDDALELTPRSSGRSRCRCEPRRLSRRRALGSSSCQCQRGPHAPRALPRDRPGARFRARRAKPPAGL